MTPASGTFNVSFPIEFKFLIIPESVQSFLRIYKQDIQSLDDFSMIPKHMTLNDPEFHVNFWIPCLC